ncbi:hypothetical protein HanOQP8_Chr12g0447321 [Helianthus annuus]|nr:hypothetical protein HanOQP8_Chr12g0447321 [Helianthus annuus]
MAKVRDRTEDFKDAVNRGALSLGFNEAKRAALMASFIIHKPRERSHFTKAALKTVYTYLLQCLLSRPGNS